MKKTCNHAELLCPVHHGGALKIKAHLRGAKSVLCVVDVDRTQKLLRSFLSIDELSFWDGAGIQDPVPV